MKLVEILARELDKWPEGAALIVQDYHGWAKYQFSKDEPEITSALVWIRTPGDEPKDGEIGRLQLAADHATAIVTRAMWEDERKRTAPDWSKAPEGATHYCPETDRPAEWDGAGLPPVGTECEHEGGTGEDEYWYPVLILAHAKVDNRYVAVFQRTDDDMEISFSDDEFFRPKQTTEDIAAENRDREIMAIECVIKDAHYGLLRTDISPSEKARHYASALHDAGYRRQ